MKKTLSVLLFMALGFGSFASVGKLKIPTKKIVKIVDNKKPYPVTGTLSCGQTVTFQSSCTGSVPECIPYWNAVFEALEGIYCGGPS